MAVRNAITIVASPRPRVGKTLLARLLTDFHRLEGRPVLGFDLNSGEGTLSQYLPGLADRASIADIRGQMALFDCLIADDGIAKVVDLGAGSFAEFFTIAERIEFAAEARRRGIAPSLLYVMTPDRTGVEAYRALYDRFPGVIMTAVHNEMLGPQPPREKYVFVGSGISVLRLAALAPGLRKFIEQPPFSFIDAELARTRGISGPGHEELVRWLRRIHLEFRELDLRLLLADLRSSIKFGA